MGLALTWPDQEVFIQLSSETSISLTIFSIASSASLAEMVQPAVLSGPPPPHRAESSATLVRPEEAKEERELSREEALRYLGGEVLEGGMRGWGVLRYRRCALGWGKGSGGQIKNHYPKGLRWR